MKTSSYSASIIYCITDLNAWIVTNKLLLSGSKTELVILRSSYFSMHTVDLKIKSDYGMNSPSEVAKSLILLNQFPDMGIHVSDTCRVSYFSIQHILKLKPMLTQYIRNSLCDSQVKYSLVSVLQIPSCWPFR